VADPQNKQTLTAVDSRSMALSGILKACEESLETGNVSHDELLESIRSAHRMVGQVDPSTSSKPTQARVRRGSTDDSDQELQPRPGVTDQLAPMVQVDVEVLGELLSNLARLCHKINNPLTSVMGRAQMMQMKMQKQGDDNDPAKKSVAVIEESAKRVAGLVQEMANLVCQGRKEFVEHCNYDSKAG
jgi:signal transduction histidine kinase